MNVKVISPAEYIKSNPDWQKNTKVADHIKLKPPKSLADYGEKKSEKNQDDEALAFFTHLAGGQCPISPNRLKELAEYVYFNVMEGRRISKCNPRYINKFLKFYEIPQEKMLKWFKEEHQILGDGQIFDNWVSGYLFWLRKRPDSHRNAATFIDLLFSD